MMLTTKGRYAVMAMADIATNSNNTPVNLATISERQKITVAYLEQIFAMLKAEKLVLSIKGPGGGYLLAKPSYTISIAMIIEAVNESIKMTRCNNRESGCVAGIKCLTHDLWDGLGNHIHSYLSSISLADICSKKIKSIEPENFQQLAMRA